MFLSLSPSLDQKIPIWTTVGLIPAEKIIFYPGDKIKRIFPLNGKLSGYWTEENEYGLTEKLDITSNRVKISAKFINLSFYINLYVKDIKIIRLKFLDCTFAEAVCYYIQDFFSH